MQRLARGGQRMGQCLQIVPRRQIHFKLLLRLAALCDKAGEAEDAVECLQAVFGHWTEWWTRGDSNP